MNGEPTTPFLDRMLLPEDAAKWLNVPPRSLMEKHRAGIIPGFRVGHSTVRFHPRTIITKMAREAGVPAANISAMFDASPITGK